MGFDLDIQGDSNETNLILNSLSSVIEIKNNNIANDITSVNDDVNLFKYGVASGDPTQNSIVLWTLYEKDNMPESTNITLTLSKDIDFNDVVKTIEEPALKSNHGVVKVLVENLESDSVYYYKFSDSDNNNSRVGRTKTLPSNKDSFNMIHSSCDDIRVSPPHVWTRIKEEIVSRQNTLNEIDCLCHLGDMIYEDALYLLFLGFSDESQLPEQYKKQPWDKRCITEEDYLERWKQWRLIPEIQVVLSIVPLIHCQDDHESLNNHDGKTSDSFGHNPTTDGNVLDRIKVSQKIRVLMTPTGLRSNIPSNTLYSEDNYKNYYKFNTNLVNIYALETRMFRERDGDYLPRETVIPSGSTTAEIIDIYKNQNASEFLEKQNDSSRKMLGSVQDEWIINEVTNNNSSWNIILSSVVFHSTKFVPVLEAIEDAVVMGDITLNDALSIAVPYLTPYLGTPTQEALDDLKFTNSNDGWGGYPVEKSNLINSFKNKNCVIMSGDSHNAKCFEDTDNKIIELASASFSARGSETIYRSVPIPLQPFMNTVARSEQLKWRNDTQRGFVISTFNNDKLDAKYILGTIVDITDDSQTWKNYSDVTWDAKEFTFNK